MLTLGLDNNTKNKLIYSVIASYLAYKSSGYVDEYFKSLLNFIMYTNKKRYVNSVVFNWAMKIPYFKNKLNSEIFEVEEKIKSDTLKLESNIRFRVEQLPKVSKDLAVDMFLENMKKNFEADLRCHNPLKLSGTLYNTPNNQETKLLKGVMDLYYKTNPLHSDIYPSLITMEKDIVNMTKSLLNCPGSQGTGTVTTGGTESIILALYGYREYAKKYKGITCPEVVAMETVHPAVDKGCHYLGIKLRKIKVDENNIINRSQLLYSINHNTIVVIGSVPSFPHGLIDDIILLNSYAIHYDVPIHVDACLGGFVFPFLEEFPPYDFRLLGVQSISVDTHKYGCCPKGSSVLVFRDKKYFECCYFIQSEWSGGIYATTNITGSRSGLNLAWTWAMLTYQGYDTLREQAHKINRNLEKIKSAFEDDSDIKIYGNPRVCVIGFGSDTLNIYKVCQNMKEKGWNLNELQNPASFHFCITNCHTDDIIDEFINNLRESLNKTLTEKNTLCLEDMTWKPGKTQSSDEGASIYGTTQKVPDQSVVDDVVVCYLNSIH